MERDSGPGSRDRGLVHGYWVTGGREEWVGVVEADRLVKEIRTYRGTRERPWGTLTHTLCTGTEPDIGTPTPGTDKTVYHSGDSCPGKHWERKV